MRCVRPFSAVISTDIISQAILSPTISFPEELQLHTLSLVYSLLKKQTCVVFQKRETFSRSKFSSCHFHSLFPNHFHQLLKRNLNQICPRPIKTIRGRCHRGEAVSHHI